MPQDRPRSVLYRSFLTCDDPRGVVECNRIRKSKTELPKMVDDKLVKRTVRESMSVSASKKEMMYEGSADELNTSCSVQLMEVSRGAQKLTRVIDSWSKGSGLDRKSKDVAKDLLKGALDLQESLEMLEKLQEASDFMAKLNKPAKDRSGKGKFNSTGVERTKSERITGVERTKSERIIGDQKYKLEFHKPRHSIDGASWDCYDELREVIRDSFARQKLLPTNNSTEKATFGSRELDFSPDLPSTSSSQSSYEKRCFDRRQLLSSPDLPSTSSSQSSVFQPHEFSYFGSSLPKVQQSKPKAPNLIAKLMGLEEIPSEPHRFTSHKQMEKDRLSNQRRPAFEIDLPKAKKPPVVVENMDTRQRTLEEIIGAMQFKGLLKSTPLNESKHGIHQPIVSDLESEVDQYCEPIVIMKPQYAPDLQAERLYSRAYPCEENSVDPKEMPTNWKRKEFTTGQPKGAPNVAVKKNLRAEKSEVTKSTREGWAKQHRETLPSPNESGTRIMGKLSSNKTINPAKPRQEKKEVIEKRVDKIQKIAPKTRKEEMKNVKFREAVKPHGLEKMTSVKPRKQETVPNISQKQVNQQKSMTSNVTLNHAAASHNSRSKKYMKKTDKPERNSSLATVENLGDNKAQIDLKSKKETDKTENKDEVSEKLHLEEEVSDVSQTLIIDDHSKAESLSFVSTVPTIHSESSSECKDRDQYFVSPKSNPEASTTKNLLLTNTSFLSHAEELFDIYAWQPVELKPGSSPNETPETKLLLDCASELLESKKLQITLCVDTLPKKRIRSQVHISLDKLVAEICDGIETLRSYKDLTATLSADTLFALVERDLQCNVAVSGAWDLGWRKGFTRDEVEHVVADMEKLILSGVLEDALADFAWQ